MDSNWTDLIEGLGEEPALSLAALEPPGQHLDVIDWDALEIIVPQEDEGRDEIVDDIRMYEVLGLTAQDEAFKNASEASTRAESGPADDVPVENISDDGNDCLGASLSADDDIPEETVVLYDPNKPCMDVGTVYPSMVEFRLAIRQFAINEEFELKIVKSDPMRFIGDCRAQDCRWHIVGRRQPDGKSVMVTVLFAKHNCTSSARRNTTTATSAWVASKAIHYLRKNSDMGTKELRKRLEEDHKCTIPYDTIWKGRQKALTQLHGSWEDSFQMLFKWRAEVLKRSPDSVIEIDVKVEDGQVYFHRFFCALGPCIQGFIEGCRPYLSIDSTALNGRWNGHMAAATSIDGHHWMYPVAYGFIDGETEDNWIWFMTQLKKAIGHLPLLAVCTDACKGLEKAVKFVFPQAEQRECFRHLMQNFTRKYHGEIFGKMYPAARAYRREVFNYFYNQVTEASSDAKAWLEKYHKLKWMRSEFNPAIKCDYVTNNIAEIFNNWIKDWKDLPITELAEKCRDMIMVLWYKRRRIGAKLQGKILPAVIAQLKARTRGLGHLSVTKADFFSAQVEDSTNTHSKHVVKAYLHYCSFLEWQATGKPCQHALALITAQEIVDVQLEDFVHDFFSVERFKNAYKRIIEPVPDKTQWPDVDLPFVVGAPLGKRGRGRPRKLRMKSCLEGGNSKGKKAAAERGKEADKEADKEAMEAAKQTEKDKKKMIRGKRKCKRCGELGHGETSYKCPLNGTKKRKRKPRKNTTKYGENAKVPNQGSCSEWEDRALVPLLMQSPTKPTMESIIQNSPIRVTRSRLAMLMGDGTASQSNVQTSPTCTTKPMPRKLTPKKLKMK